MKSQASKKTCAYKHTDTFGAQALDKEIERKRGHKREHDCAKSDTGKMNMPIRSGGKKCRNQRDGDGGTALSFVSALGK